METRANYALIGMFTLAAVAAMFGFALWFAGASGKGNRVTYRIVFSGSVSGLSRGANVLFNGLRVGEVANLNLLPEDPRRVVAIVELDPLTPMRSDTRARLEFQGLTGVAAIQLSGGEPGSQALAANPNREPPTIFADRSDFQDIMETVQRLSRRVDDVINRVERMVADNEGSIGRTVRNVETFTQALATNSDGIGRFLESTTRAGDRIAALSQRLEAMSGEIDSVIRAIEPARVSRIIANVETFSEAIGANRPQIDAIFRDAQSFAGRINETAGRLDALVGDASNVMRAIDPAAVRSLVASANTAGERVAAVAGDLQAVVRAVDPERVARIVSNVETFADVVGQNRQQIDGVIKDAAALASRLNASASRLDEVLADASGVLRAIDPAAVRSLVASANTAGARLAEVAGKIDGVTNDVAAVMRSVDPQRVARIVGNVETFTDVVGQNRAQIDSLVKDAAAFARRINETAGGLDTLIADAARVIRGVDPALLTRSLENIDRVATTIGGNNSEIDKTIKDFSAMSGRLAQASTRVESVLAAVERFFGAGPDGAANGMMADIGAAARSVRALADNLDKRTADIASGFKRLTGPGLREFEALAADGRRTLNDLSRTVRSIERNPSQVIFGGQSQLPEYRGR